MEGKELKENKKKGRKITNRNHWFHVSAEVHC
jgi:hypothetical protein